MSENSTPPTTAGRLPGHALRYGGGAGLVGALWLLVQMLAGIHGPSAMMFGLIVPIAGIVVGVMRWRDHVTGGTTSFAATFGVGLAIGLVYAAVVSACAWTLAETQPDLVFREVAKVYQGFLQQRGVPPEDMPAELEKLKAAFTPAAFARPFFATALLASLAVSFIAAIVIPRQRI